MADIIDLPPDPRLFGWPDPIGTDVPEELRCYRLQKSWQASMESMFLTNNRAGLENRQTLRKEGKIGIYKKGRRGTQGQPKLTEKQVSEIRELASDGKTQKEIAEIFGIVKMQVWRIVNRESWKTTP